MRTGPAATTLNHPDWDNLPPLSGAVSEYVAAGKGENGPEIQVRGSAGLIYTLLGPSLIDELRVWMFPWYSEPARNRAELGDPAQGPGGSHKW